MAWRSIAMALSAIGLVACGSGDGVSAPESTSAVPATSSTASPTGAVVPDALQFSAPTVGGGTFDARASAGTPLALWFWAPY